MKSFLWILGGTAAVLLIAKAAKAAKAAPPRFYMAPRFMEDGRLYPGGDQFYSIDQNAWVEKKLCGR
jgi:hypothetical protein